MNTLFKIFLSALCFINITNVSAQEIMTVDSSLITKIDKQVAEIEAFRKQHKPNEKIFIIKEQNEKLVLAKVPVGTSDDITEATYYLLYDDQGRLLSHSEIPTSYSGDWYREWTHYFDKAGQTVMFKHYSYHYNSGCTYLLQVTARYYFDSQVKLIKKSTAYTDKDDAAIPNPESCQQYQPDENDADVMMPTYSKIEQRISRNLLLYKDRRNISNSVEASAQEKERQWQQAEEQRRLQQAQEDEKLARIKKREQIIRAVLYLILVIAVVQAIRSFVRAFRKNK